MLIERRTHLFHIAGNGIFNIIFLPVVVRILINPILLMKEAISRLYTTLKSYSTDLYSVSYSIKKSYTMINNIDTKVRKKVETIKES